MMDLGGGGGLGIRELAVDRGVKGKGNRSATSISSRR
jgi:hypothetical protein